MKVRYEVEIECISCGKTEEYSKSSPYNFDIGDRVCGMCKNCGEYTKFIINSLNIEGNV